MFKSLTYAKNILAQSDADTDSVTKAYSDLKESMNNLKKVSNSPSSDTDKNVSKDNSQPTEENATDTSISNTPTSSENGLSVKTADTSNIFMLSTLITLLILASGFLISTFRLKDKTKKNINN